MAKIVDRVKVNIATTGQGTVTFGSRASSSFYVPSETELADGDQVEYILTENGDEEHGIGTIGGSVTTCTRDTVYKSIIGGSVGTTKMSLSGSAVFGIVATKEAFRSFRQQRTVTTTSDTIANSDGGGIISYNSASAVAVALAQAGASGLFLKNWWVLVRNIGAGIVTITPTTSTIDGSSSIKLKKRDKAIVYSDGSNYQAVRISWDGLSDQATAVASASTTDIWNIDGNSVHVTGTTGITGFGTAEKAGLWRIVIFDGALTLTHNASTLVLPGAANIATAANDRALVYSDSTTKAVVVAFIKANGKPVIGPAATDIIDSTSVGQSVVTASDAAAARSAISAIPNGPFGPMVNGTIVESHSSNAVTFAIKTLAGNDPSAGDPVYFVFNDGAGSYIVRTITAALSITVSSGSTLGAINGQAFRVWLAVFDDAGTVRMAVRKCSTATQVYGPMQGITYSSTAEGGAGAADSSHVFYTGSAVTSKQFRWIGHADYESGLTTAGTWAASPTRIALVGPGSALPGSVIQHVTATNAQATSTSSSSYQSTNLSASITPDSSVNLIRVDAFGSLYGPVAETGANICIDRGSGVLVETENYTGTTPGIHPAAIFCLDFPNNSGNLTYTVKIKSRTGNTVTWNQDHLTCAMVLTEIMG